MSAASIPLPRLALVEGATLALVASLLIGLLTLALAPFAAGFLAVALWRLGAASHPTRLADRVRAAAVAVGVQAAVLGAAGLVAVTIGRPSTPFTILNAVAGLLLLVGLHLYVDGFRAGVDDDAVRSRFGRVWRTLRLLDLFIAIGLGLSALYVASGLNENESLEITFSVAPAAIFGLGVLYRLTRADLSLRRHLAAI